MISATYNQETGNIANPTEIIQTDNPEITTILPVYESKKNPIVTIINASIPDRIPNWRIDFLPNLASRKLVNIVLVKLAE